MPALARSSAGQFVTSSPRKWIVPAVISYSGDPSRVFPSVLLPEPLGPMMACTSPAPTVSERPLMICLPATSTWRSLISSIFDFRFLSASAHAALERDAQKLPGLDGEFHGQLLHHLAAEAADDEGHRVLGRDAAAAAVE